MISRFLEVWNYALICHRFLEHIILQIIRNRRSEFSRLVARSRSQQVIVRRASSISARYRTSPGGCVDQLLINCGVCGGISIPDVAI
jgi:hypothetical protein